MTKKNKHKRSPAREMSVWKRRVAELLAKETRCPGCAKAIRELADTKDMPICEGHRRIRRNMALS